MRRRVTGLLAGTLLACTALTGPMVAMASVAQAAPSATPSLTQAVSPSLLGVPVGGSAILHFVVSNTGSSTATHVKMNFEVQSNDVQRPQLAGFSSSNMTFYPNYVTWSAGTISPGRSVYLDIRVRAPAVANDSEVSYSTRADGLAELCDNHACLDAAQVRTPQPSTAYIASSRKASAVYINGLIKQRDAHGAIRSPGRTAYLQRQLGSGWQTMLLRQANAMGELTVGFIQTRVYRYRLVVVASPSGLPTVSAVTTR